ncbi:hypothetical protein P280DRAFT_538815 [Massarina eburnea CBS 473.64]|uniref:Amidohydrolase-related domain-containing protein n=1 Tax=Massarina eburnea CBS 473.64 TaxID=1395130 RepID=A0A6A6S8A1_9PLEO|nr:hypothetical protein P280DRAFT_538815 [Massarina eburnea CBS 473.64]
MSSTTTTTTEPTHESRITSRAKRDNIDLTTLPFLSQALSSIATLSTTLQHLPPFHNASRIDTHTHPIPAWFRTLQPLAAGRATPSWDPISHLEFMAAHSIAHSVLCFSTPQANAFPGDKEKTVALARLLNEFCAELGRVCPGRFSWLAVLPLPYAEEAAREVAYALDVLGAVGVGVLSNHEGWYPGDDRFVPVWEALQKRGGREVVFIHPTDPVLRLEGGALVDSKPCKSFCCGVLGGDGWGVLLTMVIVAPLRSGLGEFYFETARAISSITANRTIIKFPNIHWRVSHGAGAFPDIQDRFLLGFPRDAEEARRIYAERFWYDSAGPVYPRQIKGLMAHGVPVSQFVFGTDYPYGIGFWDVDANINGLADADFLSAEEKEGVFYGNAKELWKGKIPEL